MCGLCRTSYDKDATNVHLSVGKVYTPYDKIEFCRAVCTMYDEDKDRYEESRTLYNRSTNYCVISRHRTNNVVYDESRTQ